MANQAGKQIVELPKPDTWYTRLVKHRTPVVILVGSILVLIDAVDHYDPGNPILFSPKFWIRIPIYGLLIPFLVWTILCWLTHLEREHDQVLQGIDRLRKFSHRLTQASSNLEMIQEIVQFPASIIPEASTSLYLYNNDLGRFFPAWEWCGSSGDLGGIEYKPSPNQCLRCIAPRPSLSPVFSPCWLFSPESYSSSSQHYCFPLVANQENIALLQIELPGGHTVTSNQMRLLTNYLPEIALAIKNAQLMDYTISQSKAREAERRQIAWELHDSLGQDITFLRLKLEQLKTNGSLQSIAAIQKDLTRMLEIANQAYEQVRFTLKNLYQNNGKDWLAILQAYGQFIANQSDMHFYMEVTGRPVTLAPEVIRQVSYICREALNNIQEHARARQARLSVTWEERAIEIRISDDGCGFDTETALAEGNFGLKIMQERARFLGGNLAVFSIPNQGTEIVLRLPEITGTQMPRPVDELKVGYEQ